jgi:PEP-CTERM motif
MKSIVVLGIAVWATFGGLPETAQAAPITYTLSGTGSGSVNGTSFTNQAFTIMGVGDTVDLTTVSADKFPAVPLSSMSFTMSGFGTATPSNQMYMVNLYNLAADFLGFGNVSIGDGEVFFAAGSGAWDLVSSFGPVSATSAGSGYLPTNLGTVQLSGYTGPTTFTATLGSSAVPEPGTFAMLALGLSLSLVARRRK